jgi:ferredoxin
MRVIADKDRCEGHGLCATVAPEVFDLDDEGVVVVLTPDLIPADLETKAVSGARSCPVAALDTSP